MTTADIHATLNPAQRAAATHGKAVATGGIEAVDGRMLQGFVEESNVNPILQVSRMIEVQRAYELGQSFMEQEDERIRGVVAALGRRG